MIAEIISIGDELTSGQRLDTNSQWLSVRLGDLGIKTHFHTTVGDTLADNIDAFRIAARRADVIIATGGLGPTADDLTREAIATAFHQPLELRTEALAHIESLFAKRKRPMPERNRVQAMMPATSIIIDNPHGTAPGIDLVIPAGDVGNESASRVFSLPGVPAEMMQMYEQTVEPKLIGDLGAGQSRWFYHCLKLFGIGESDVEKQIPDLIERDRDPLVGITVSRATITLRIAARCASRDEFEQKIAPTVQMIHEKLGLLIFGTGDHDLDHAVANQLHEQNVSLGLIEVGSGAWIQSMLTAHSDSLKSGLQSSRWYPNMTALAADWPETSDASVESKTDRGSEANSPDAMHLIHAAEQLRSRFNLDYTLAVGTYPARALIEQSATLPSTEFVMALARRDRSAKTTTITIAGHPEVLYARLAKTGLNFLRLELLRA